MKKQTERRNRKIQVKLINGRKHGKPRMKTKQKKKKKKKKRL